MGHKEEQSEESTLAEWKNMNVQTFLDEVVQTQCRCRQAMLLIEAESSKAVEVAKMETCVVLRNDKS